MAPPTGSFYTTLAFVGFVSVSSPVPDASISDHCDRPPPGVAGSTGLVPVRLVTAFRPTRAGSGRGVITVPDPYGV